MLPIREAEAPCQPSIYDGQNLSLQGVKAIVVDDEIDAQTLLKLILEDSGAQVKSTKITFVRPCR